MTRDLVEFLYRVADKFVLLEYMDKVRIGTELELISEANIVDNEDQLDLIIFKGAYKKNKLKELSSLVYEIDIMAH
jgi:hypothetical protein